jgi:transposase
MNQYVGLDVSLKEVAICVINEEGAIEWEGTAPSEPDAIADWLLERDVHPEKVGLEIGGLARWLYSELKTRGLPAICIDPRRLRALTKTMPVKTDRNDARAIAQVIRVGWYRPVHIKSPVSQELRMLLSNRKTLLVKYGDIENEVRGTLRVFGLKLSGRISPAQFERRALELVEDRPRLAAMVKPMLVARSALREQCEVLHRMLLKAVKEDETCHRLMTVPGVGAITAVTFMAVIDDPARFQHSRDVGAHLGMTPRKYASGETDRNGAISKCGDTLLRSTLYQAALALLTRTSSWSTLKAWGMAVAKRRGLRRAIIAVARKLAIVLHRIWADGTEFRWGREEAAA